MKHGFVKVAAVTPEVRVADVAWNAEKTIAAICEADAAGVKIAVFPELGLTGYTCGDLFFQEGLLAQAKAALIRIAQKTKKTGVLAVVGLPLAVNDLLVNAAAFLKGGEILGVSTKSNPVNHSEFYEKRYFSVLKENTVVVIDEKEVPIGPNLLFCAQDLPQMRIAAQIGEGLTEAQPQGVRHAINGATVLANPAAGNEIVGKAERRRCLLQTLSESAVCGYVFANAAAGESTTDLVFGGHAMIWEQGTLLKESKPFSGEELVISEIDVNRLVRERRRLGGFDKQGGYQKIPFTLGFCDTKLTRKIPALPFIPENPEESRRRCEEIFAIQCHGLKKRLEHIGLKTVTIGISGGLDSTLALLVTVGAFDALSLPREGIIAVTMPCFGTSDRTYQNAKKMIESLGVQFREVGIRDAVTGHLKDIGADLSEHDVTYENAQARERTQVLMDIANKTGGIVVGTGDLSELALGFATYNGDHMSMYGVNASVPKTLMRHMVKYVADNSDTALKEILYDVIQTPVSPELLPPEEDGTIAQQTEEIVGPYELHDFFLFYLVRFGFSKEKIQRLAEYAFQEEYDGKTIAKWLDVFIKRFSNNQFKRSCLPDGPKVGSVGLSPRGDWRMPSDAAGDFTALP